MEDSNKAEIPTADAGSDLASLCANWPTLSLMARSEHLRALTGKGHSRRGLARILKCSESLVRQLLKLQDLSVQEKEAVDKGSLSVRAALRKLQAVKIPDKQPLGKGTRENSASIESLVWAFRGWILGLKLRHELMLRNLFFRLQGKGGWIQEGWISAEEARSYKGCENMPIEQRIACSQPQREMPDDRREPGRYLSYLCEWYGRWSLGLIPEQETRHQLVDAAERSFRIEGWRI